MNKTDNRIYNRKANRDLSIEMDLWILLHGKLFEAKNCFYDNKPVYGIIENVSYDVRKSANFCDIALDNGTKYTLRVKFGKLVKDEKVSFLS